MARQQALTLKVAVFAAGAGTMILEIAGVRLLTPYVGTSIFVWTSLIGVMLGSLTLGYWLGGRAADRDAAPHRLALLFLAAGALTIAAVLFHAPFLQALSALEDVRAEALLAAAVLFGPATLCLGAVAPYAAKLQLTNLATTGTVIGNLAAFSALGSIAGTFSAGFLLIPLFGTRAIIFMLGGGLLMAGILLALALSAGVAPSRRWRATPFLLFALGVLVITGLIVLAAARFETAGGRLGPNGIIFEAESPYNRVWVVDGYYGGRRVRNLITDPQGIQSQILLDSEDLNPRYLKYFRLVRHFAAAARHALMLGGGAYAYPMDYVKYNPAATIDVVELDPLITELARAYFRFTDHPRIRIIHEDGRIFLNRARRSYDAMFVDAFLSCYPPYHLTTVEAVEHLHRLLAADGVVIVNLVSALTGDSGAFLRAEYATYARIFPDVYLFQVDDRLPAEFQNVILVARKSDRAAPLVSGDPELNEYLGRRISLKKAAPPRVLSDDFAPVEHLVRCPVNRDLSKIISN